MQLRAISTDQTIHPNPTPSVPQAWLGVLNSLRLIALECRVSARTDLFEACALLSHERNTSRDAHARALLKCLRQAISHQPTFHQPGTHAVSFDEAWLVQALVAASGEDHDSFAFLIRSRVPHVHQRNIAFLIKGISEQFCRI